MGSPKDTRARRRLRHGAAILIWAGCVAAAGPVAAQQIPALRGPLFPPFQAPPSNQRPPLDVHGQFLLHADEVDYDRDNEVVTAVGHVEISQGDRVLQADRITYNRQTEIVTATGHVSLLEPTGEVVFGDYVEVNQDLKEGLIQKIRVLLADNSRIAASGGRLEDNRKEMANAVFSPCNLCKEHPENPPIWQLKGKRVVHDEDTHDVVYHDASLEIYGIPVFYTPYFSHPDPTIRQRSGLLAPSFGGSSSKVGTFAGIPYYGVLSDTQDMTIEPRVYFDDGLQLGTEYRQAFSNGIIRLAGSAIDGRKFEGSEITNEKQFHGNVAGEGRFEINDNWRAGFDINRETDINYMRLYQVPGTFRSKGRYQTANQLTTDAYGEGFFGSNYASIENYAFQSLRTQDNPSTIGRVLPFAQYSYISGRDGIGGYVRSDSNLLSINRDIGAKTNRVATRTGYYLPMISGNGSVWDFSATVETDGYYVADFQPSTGAPIEHGFTGRVLPQLAATWRYPMISRYNAYALTVEPIVGTVVGTTNVNPAKIPNEDSQGFDFDETNLFSLNRFAGYDRVSGGQRVNYGISVGVNGVDGGGTRVFIGQSYQFQRDPAYTVGSGLGAKGRSDIVGRISVQPQRYVDLSYRFRLDRSNLKLNRDEISATFSKGSSAISISYIQRRVIDLGDSQVQPIQSIGTSFSTPLYGYWSLYGQGSHDLKNNQSTSLVGGLLYRDECFALLLSADRSFAQSGTPTGTSFLARVGFKDVGDIGL